MKNDKIAASCFYGCDKSIPYPITHCELEGHVCPRAMTQERYLLELTAEERIDYCQRIVKSGDMIKAGELYNLFNDKEWDGYFLGEGPEQEVKKLVLEQIEALGDAI